MQDSPAPKTRSFPPTRGILFQLWRGFWLITLFVSLGYAWYCFYVPSNNIAWAQSYPADRQQAVPSDRPMILFFTGKWCVPCRIMKRTVWADEEVEAVVNADFTPLLINFNEPGPFSEALERYQVHFTPTTIITDAEGNVLEKVESPMNKSEFLNLIEKAKRR